MRNIVIGSGPAGRLASLQLGKLGEDVTLIEKNHIAGTCLNEGCMVICALTDITKFIDANKRFNAHGFLKSQLEISYEKIVEKISETQEKLRHINQLENESVGNNIIYGEASINKDETVEVNGESLEYDNLLVATGARPFIPQIKGKEYGLTNKDILKIDDVPDKLNIIGGGIIAGEIANIYSTLGSEVNILARSSFLKEITPNAKKYVLKNIMSDINVYENVNVSEVFKNKVLLENGEELEGVPFFATGRVPNSEIVSDIVELNDDKTIKVNEMMKTSVDNIYAAGDVTGRYQLTPVARKEGIIAARNMAKYANKVSYNCVPQTLSLNMEVSFVENEKSTCSDEDKQTIAIPSIAGPGSFWNILSGDTGYCEIEFDSKNNKINKINSISPSSVSDVAYLSYLMRMEYDLDDYDEFLEIHPSSDTNYKIIKNMWL
ncbi:MULTISPECIES: FAD-dependent oxidoreductase [Methanobrevibacter]|uniref:FAD-dependent oxidoreductase n=1 Tax=Methanobrevibacter TaxID=2172 RepID=UPI0025D53431|nr:MULTISPECIES: FAD-dependent oxidoreductase [Methanobrevibacter]MBS7258012.1 NAD(P)/FAD-dependent oxidoreductase [Methanobrevibacter sp.]MCI7427808.1 FAD-dependent oxidoreductase [Methanobrevibacter sp.]MDD6776644.1 FAD-dependent oxidoreductase [Methanobacteriaceae archaeon]MDY3096472.1 FAD-dependent oxidoreductase [Methanobrevibacter sp.]